jgi:periplasmic protein TonB
MVEVSVEEIKDSRDTSSTPGVEEVRKTINSTPGVGVVQSKAGVIVKANPDYFKNPAPPYPELAKQMRQEGFVMLSVEVGTRGEPIKVDITQSSGYHLLDQAALEAVSHWKFQPGSIDNVAVDSTVTVPIRFHLERE